MKLEDMLIILLIVVILFGGSRIPQLGAGLGKGLRSFKRALEGKDEEESGAAPQSADNKDHKDPVKPASK